MPDRISLIQTSVENREQASALADGLIAGRLAACVQIMHGGESHYHWQGNIETTTECYLSIKTRPDLCKEVMDWIAQKHPYEIPEILAMDLEASPTYARWVEQETQPQGGGIT